MRTVLRKNIWRRSCTTICIFWLASYFCNFSNLGKLADKHEIKLKTLIQIQFHQKFALLLLLDLHDFHCNFPSLCYYSGLQVIFFILLTSFLSLFLVSTNSHSILPINPQLTNLHTLLYSLHLLMKQLLLLKIFNLNKFTKEHQGMKAMGNI